jgi:hypothetical protein
MAGTAAALAQQVVGGVPVPRTVRASAPTVRESVAWKAGADMRAGNGSGDDQARRFRDAALPHLDDVYTLARYLLRDGANATTQYRNAICARYAISIHIMHRP